jgi:hypothetical protein
MRKFLGAFIAICAFVSLLDAKPQSGIRAIWAVNDGEKVERDDNGHPSRESSSVWDGRTIKLFAARNEVVAFQLIAEAGEKRIDKLSVALNQLVLRGGHARIAYQAPTGDPTQYSGRPISIFSVNYMNVREPTNAGWIFRTGTPAAPRDPVGWKPVQLVPENAKPGTGGFPVQVNPGQNQAFWIEIYTRRDLPAGLYEGNVLVKADGDIRNVPIELEIFDFALPDTNSMHAMVYYSSDQPQLYHGANLDAQYHRFAHRHRIELVHAYSIESARAAIGRFSGTDFSKRHGYEGPGEGVGSVIVPASFYGPGRAYDDRATAWSASDAWMTFLKASIPGAITFLYMPDEPAPSEFARIRKIAANVHSNPGPGRDLPILVTRRYTKELDGAIDIWDSGPEGYDIELARKERALGRDYWVYNGGRPAGGAITIDAPATDPRAMFWACFKHDIRVYFYWYGVHWRHNSQKQGERVQNVWANPVTFDNRGQPRKPIQDQGFANGDGVLMYPGEEKPHPDEDRGIAGPCSTLQLANIRRGLQDHLYLTMARRLGLAELVNEAVRTVVPRVFSEATETVGFAETGDAYEAARLKLGRAIAAARRDKSQQNGRLQ